ncbi:peroxiredoxin-like family protein [uncultured Flavobacterium sp.]|uniref:peroxiredoxin-like family protein n=1 Tax=uncultured Flavobacterium sp. TaxID=165435 RepID=UPI0030EB4AD6|tara:strand:- start:720 stop:1499 length:780 start_codon:yes stop_codon:yes gene_type:complete
MILKKKILITATLVLALSSCNSKKKEDVDSKEETKKEVTMETTNNSPLDSLLNIKKEEFSKKASEEKKQIYADGLTDVKNSGILNKALNVGDKAPSFTLKNALNKPVSLYDELKKGPVILTWYRGGWCPYCNITLNFLQEKLPEFKKAGATLIALTPEKPDKSLSTTEKNKLEFTVLSDLDNKIGKEYGVVFTLTKGVASIYEEAFGLSDFNGNKDNELPLAATYVIDKNGIIQYAFLDEDYRKRAEPNEVIKAIEKLK